MLNTNGIFSFMENTNNTDEVEVMATGLQIIEV
jgi:hypothetical protein